MDRAVRHVFVEEREGRGTEGLTILLKKLNEVDTIGGQRNIFLWRTNEMCIQKM